MPVMDLHVPEWEALLPINVQAYMHYPEDEPARDAFIAHKIGEVLLATAHTNNDDYINMPTDLLDIILRTRGTVVHEVTREIVESGAIAGQILLGLLKMQSEGIEASVNKAIHLSIAFYENAASKNGDKLKAKSVRAFRKAWSDYKSVGYLWAAVQLTVDSPADYAFNEAIEDKPLLVLGLARKLLHMTKDITNKNAQGPSLSYEEMWTIPEDIALPDVEVSFNGLSKAQRERLKTYTARDMTSY